MLRAANQLTQEPTNRFDNSSVDTENDSSALAFSGRHHRLDPSDPAVGGEEQAQA